MWIRQKIRSADTLNFLVQSNVKIIGAPEFPGKTMGNPRIPKTNFDKPAIRAITRNSYYYLFANRNGKTRFGSFAYLTFKEKFTPVFLYKFFDKYKTDSIAGFVDGTGIRK